MGFSRFSYDDERWPHYSKGRVAAIKAGEQSVLMKEAVN
jgi:hypothetical protein